MVAQAWRQRVPAEERLRADRFAVRRIGFSASAMVNVREATQEATMTKRNAGRPPTQVGQAPPFDTKYRAVGRAFLRCFGSRARFIGLW